VSDELGYQDNTAGPGKQSFVPKGGKENKGGNAPRQDGKNSDKKVQSREHLWKESDSEGKN
jgi:hypothetical protein